MDGEFEWEINAVSLADLESPSFSWAGRKMLVADTSNAATDGRLRLQFRNSHGGGSSIRLMRSADLLSWTQYEAPAADITVLDDDVDGDGKTRLLEVSVPRDFNGSPAWYRLDL